MAATNLATSSGTKPQQPSEVGQQSPVDSTSHKPTSTPRPPRRKLSIPEYFRDGFVSVSSDKAAVSRLLQAHDQLKQTSDPAALTGAQVADFLHSAGGLGPLDLDAGQVKASFQSGTPLLARTLTKGNNDPAVTQIPSTSTPTRVERNTLNNRLRGLNIVLTPSTMLDKDVQVSTISSHPDRPKWSKMPSVLYTAPTEKAPASTEDRLSFKPTFGNVLSFASNEGFTPDFVQKMNSGEHSHAELISEFRAQPKITSNLKAGAPFNTLPQSLSDLKKQVASYRESQTKLLSTGQQANLYPDGSVPHNEVIARLWIWDASAVDVGQDLNQGLNTSVELQIARSALGIELDQLGTDHPMFQDFVKQQLSLGDDRKPLTMSETQARYDALSPDDRASILQALKTRLSEPISVCRYNPSEPSINSIAPSEITGSSMVQAVESVLSARLGKMA